MTLTRSEPSIDQLLVDPLIRKMLRADRVALADFECVLRAAAARLHDREDIIPGNSHGGVRRPQPVWRRACAGAEFRRSPRPW